MSAYKEKQWYQFRQSVLELDGFKCKQCGRGKDEAVLQVHHLNYKLNLKSWEYATADCITLCKGCHAQIHGITQPKFGWELLGEEDLGSPLGSCENSGCGNDIRYSFTVFHPSWGTLEVGSGCCDFLTDSEVASNFKDSKMRYESRRTTFSNSKRWIIVGETHQIRHGLFDIQIFLNDSQFILSVNGYKGKKRFNSLKQAKESIFDLIENGELIHYFKSKNLNFGVKEKSRKK